MSSRRFLLTFVLVAVAGAAAAATNVWTTLSDCRLSEPADSDGDSFLVTHGDATHLFRLYFVDCPEADRQVPSRVRRQAAHWATDEAAVLAGGQAAARFTRQALERPFTVHTRWQDARGKSRRPRRFAFVTTHAGQDLGEALVRAGLARAYGASAPHPNGTSVRATWNRLDALEAEARKQGHGCWAR
jgi:endonuclease YncB( thermonuclease family)